MSEMRWSRLPVLRAILIGLNRRSDLAWGTLLQVNLRLSAQTPWGGDSFGRLSRPLQQLSSGLGMSAVSGNATSGSFACFTLPRCLAMVSLSHPRLAQFLLRMRFWIAD